MPKRKIPYALDMRRLKYGQATDAERAAAAQALRAANRRPEVLLLFERHPEDPILVEEAAWAAETGQAFHLLSVQRIGVPVSEAQIRACAKKALADGRAMDARACYLALEDEDAIRAFSDELPEGMRPAAKAEGEAEQP